MLRRGLHCHTRGNEDVVAGTVARLRSLHNCEYACGQRPNYSSFEWFKYPEQYKMTATIMSTYEKPKHPSFQPNWLAIAKLCATHPGVLTDAGHTYAGQCTRHAGCDGAMSRRRPAWGTARRQAAAAAWSCPHLQRNSSFNFFVYLH
jgi:hypothetical protein